MRNDKAQEQLKLTGMRRSKNIDIHDSYMSFVAMPRAKLFENYKKPNDIKLWECTKLNPRSPFTMDDEILNYDQDSEEEYNDFAGEAVSSNDGEEDDDDNQSLYDEGFIIADDDFDEFSDTDLDDNERAQVKRMKKSNILQLRERRLAMVQQHANINIVMTR